MKKLILLVVPLLLFVQACDDSFNPNADFLERNALNGIMRADTSFQVITLTRSYQPEGEPPYTDLHGVPITGAEVNVWYQYKLYPFRDSMYVNENGDEVHFYYNDSLKPVNNEFIDVEALLPNNLLLRSATQTPSTRYFFFTGSADKIPEDFDGQTLHFEWTHYPDTYYLPRLVMYYFDSSTADETVKTYQLPAQIDGDGNMVYPVYTRNNFYEFNRSAINQALINLGAENPDASIFVVNAALELMILDPALSTYYSSIEGGLDGFTVKTDLPDFTNIEGGFGIFGSFSIKPWTLTFSNDYLGAYGFRTY